MAEESTIERRMDGWFESFPGRYCLGYYGVVAACGGTLESALDALHAALCDRAPSVNAVVALELSVDPWEELWTVRGTAVELDP